MVKDPYKKQDLGTSLRRGSNFFWNRRIELLTGMLMLVGIILSFFYIHIGGLLVGLAVGICFFSEIRAFILISRDRYAEHGLFKVLMMIGTFIYFLIAIPTFIIFVAVGFAAVYLIRSTLVK
jgi:hypothetical protein